jgi:hypothetical protein
MKPTARFRHDVIDRVRDSPTVLAAMIISGEDSPARQRSSAMIRNFDHVEKSDHERIRQAERFRPQQSSVMFDDLSLLVEDETDSATARYDAQGLE